MAAKRCDRITKKKWRETMVLLKYLEVGLL
jgi:hypothetical protein